MLKDTLADSTKLYEPLVITLLSITTPAHVTVRTAVLLDTHTNAVTCDYSSKNLFDLLLHR